MKKILPAALLCAVCMAALLGCRKKVGDGGGEASRPQPASAEVPSRPVTAAEAAESVGPADRPDSTEVAASEPARKIMALKVFYAGMPETDRAKDFADFLAEHFAEVGRGDYAAFRPEQADGYDVVILDYDGLDLSSPKPDLPQDYVRATVTVGVPGAMLCSRLNLKTGYL
ncbi:MAG: hypothetical protein IH624_18175 [Phycisphaerae bacterium]|nr:hypothetical protein [Phycisphaerae bacterium]